MCGRFALYGPIKLRRELRQEAFEWEEPMSSAIDRRSPRYNVAPTQTIPIVRVRDAQATVDEMRWGLVPAWAKDVKIGNKAINARAETVDAKPMFRGAFKARRCLVPAQGYFEWKGDSPNKQPYFIHAPDKTLLLFAGLWEHWWPVKDAEPVLTFTVVTGPPGLVSGDIHDRAPVILPAATGEAWLKGSVEDAKEILATFTEPQLTYYPVSKAVGPPKNDQPDLVAPIELSA